jgi:argonaute-like protein implicated in RNA metabolism and viral defense
VVLSPQARSGQTSFDAPYYRVKKLLLERGFPSQMVNEDTLQDPEFKDLNFALDIFAKAGFVPWVLGEGMPQVDLVVGLSSSIVTRAGSRSSVLGYANVFDEYGRWLFYQGSAAAVPFERRNQMFATLLQEIAREYQAKKRKLQWVHVHHSAKLRREDRMELAKGLHAEAPDAEISFVHLNEHSAFRLFDANPRGDAAAPRGSWVRLTPNSFVIATTGPNRMGQRYLGTPQPLEVRVNRVSSKGSLDLALHAQQIISLTRLNWASVRAFCHTPISVKFANDIARLMNVIGGAPDEFRLHERLRHTPWFL